MRGWRGWRRGRRGREGEGREGAGGGGKGGKGKGRRRGGGKGRKGGVQGESLEFLEDEQTLSEEEMAKQISDLQNALAEKKKSKQ